MMNDAEDTYFILLSTAKEFDIPVETAIAALCEANGLLPSEIEEACRRSNPSDVIQVLVKELNRG